MRRLGLLLLMLVLPPLVAFAPGCSGNTAKKDEPKADAAKKDEPKADAAKKDDGKKSGGKTELAAKGWGTFKGKVVYDGTPPEQPDIAQMKEHKDKDVCLAGTDREKIQQEWLVSEDKGVSDVVVFLKAPAGSYFPIHDEDKKRSDTVVLDQPHCVFLPHTLVLYPSYYDGKKQTSSGQKFVVKNSSSILHNTTFTGESILNNNPAFTLSAGDQKDVTLKAQKNAIPVKCDVHPWMKAYTWVFDHPYAARTNEKGEFEIKHVPAGVPISVVVWHDGSGADGFVTADGFGGASGKEFTFEDGKATELNLKIKKN